MKRETYGLWMMACLTLGYLGGSRGAIAQIVSDGTLPVNSIVTPDGSTLTIDGGTAAGGNLFHSFQDFNVPINDIAHFNNALTIDNIITRVTGGNISNIDGIIRANGTANLFLINPAGLVFGENASLDIGGSFVGSTAEALQFEDGSVYSAVDVDAPPLLTINVPVGLQFGSQPGDIEVEGGGHSLRFEDIELPSGQEIEVLLRDFRPPGLQVRPDRTFALVGGEINMMGGNLTAESGRIELGSVAGNSSVTLTPVEAGWQFGYEGVEQFGDIRFSEAASIDTSGPGSGAVQIQGRSLSLTDGSAIVALTLGDEVGEDIAIRTTDSVEFVGVSSEGEIRSGILADVEWRARGNGPTVNIETGRLQLIDSARISASTRGRGRGGDISITARESVELMGELDDSSRLLAEVGLDATGDGGNITIESPRVRIRDRGIVSTTTEGHGRGGNLRIDAPESVELGNQGVIRTASERESSGDAGHFTLETDRLTVLEGSGIETTSKGQGDAGNIDIVASHVEVRGEDIEDRRVSRIEAATTRRSGGNAGDVTLRAESLRVLGGALVSSTALGGENGGNLTIVVPDIEVSGETMNGRTSRLIAEMGNNATGNGGTLTLQTDYLIVSGGGVISVAAPQGEAGVLSITARDIEVMGTSRNETKPSSLIADTFSQNTGESGTLSIRTERLAVREGGSIQASTLGDGFGGNLTIEATESIELTENSSIETTTSGISTGRGGDVTIGTNNLTLEDGARIATTTKGGGDAGDLMVTAGVIELSGIDSNTLRPSRLEAQVNEDAPGDGGNLTVQADRLSIFNGARISAATFGVGNAGNIEITAPEIELIGGRRLADGLPSGLVVEVSASGQGDGGNIRVNTSDLRLQDGMTITTAARNNSNGGNIDIDTENLVLDDSRINANAFEGTGGNVQITAQGIFTDTDTNSAITASSERGIDGTIILNTPDVDPSSGLLELPDTPIDATALIGRDPCRHGDRSEFVNTGRGGLPPTPRGELLGESGWAQLVTLDSSVLPATSDAIPQPQPDRLVEAQGWIIEPDGTVILTANPPTVTPHGNGQFRITCPSSEFGEEG